MYKDIMIEEAEPRMEEKAEGDVWESAGRGGLASLLCMHAGTRT